MSKIKKIFQPLIWIAGSVLLIRLESENLSTQSTGPLSPNQNFQSKVLNKTAPIKVGKKIGRNEPCPCGSGKKYKKCHG